MVKVPFHKESLHLLYHIWGGQRPQKPVRLAELLWHENRRRAGNVRWQMATALVLLCTLATAGTAASAAGAETEAEWKVAAGVTPDSLWYSLDRAAEGLQLALTSKVEKRASLQSGLAVERASEAVVMAERGKVELATRAATESSRAMTAAATHLSRVMEREETAGDAELQVRLEAAHKRSLAALTRVVEKAPASAQVALRLAIANQEKTAAALAQFQQASKAFLAMSGELQLARKALAEARRGGDPAAVLEAEARVRALEGRKSELQELKDRADKAKEVVGEQLEAVTESLMKTEERAAPPKKSKPDAPREKENPKSGGKGPRN